VLREATRSSIQIAGLSSVDLRSARVPSASVFCASARSLAANRLGALQVAPPETSDQRSGRRIRKSSTGNAPRDECHGYEHQDDCYETGQ
jgi:hypothetical protein